MMANIRSFFGCQTGFMKTTSASLLLHIFVYQMSNLCKVLSQYTSYEGRNIDKVVPEFNEFKDEM
jgi:hypothetical protein